MEEKRQNQFNQGSENNGRFYENPVKDSNLELGSYFKFLSNKAQKITTAVYMLSNFFDPNESLRVSLRNLVTNLLSLSMSLRNAPTRERQAYAKIIILRVEEISALCSVAYSAGLISEMNHAILSRELRLFISDIEPEKLLRDDEKLVLSARFFESVESKELPKNGLALSGESLFERKIFKRQTESKGTPGGLGGINKGHTKGQVNLKDNNSHLSLKIANDDRKERIIKVFKDTNQSFLGIKDFSLSIRDWSEKTIQRQLLDLVKSGVLRKEGERRWSRYSLKTSL